MVVGVDFFLATLDNLTIDILIDRNAALLVERFRKVVTLGMMITIARALVDGGPSFRVWKEGRRIDSDDS